MHLVQKSLCSILAALILIVSGPWPTLAQQGTSVIAGSVVNTQKSPVPGIKILAKDPSGKILGEAVTDAEGNYQLKNLSVGQYQLTLDPVKSPFQGETVVAALGLEGLTVDWVVSKSAKAIAAATLGVVSSGPVALGEISDMAATAPGTTPPEPLGLSELSKGIIVGVVGLGGLGSMIWGITQSTKKLGSPSL